MKPASLRRAIFLTLSMLVCFPASSCSDNGSGKDGSAVKDGGWEQGPGKDVSLKDGVVDAAPGDLTGEGLGPANLGEGCISAKDCKPGSPLCVQYTNLFAGVKPAGICTKSCKPDNPATSLVDEDDCPKPNSVCATFKLGSITVNYCLKSCKPSLTRNPCSTSSKQTCHPLSTIYTRRPETAACLYPACVKSQDCPAYSNTDCNIDADCKLVALDAFCEPVSKLCGRPGFCSNSGLCGAHGYGKATAKVGDPCKDDFECPHNGVCMKERRNASGAIGVHNSNGYCVIPYCSFSNALTSYACPTESVCHWGYYGGMCFKTCKLDTASSCRGNSEDSGGDYECYAWNRWQFGSGAKVTAEPVCMSAATQTCDSLPTGYDCSTLGDDTNSTKMECADRATGQSKSNKADPSGVCLDNTASGKFIKPPSDAGPDSSTDSGPLDSGPPDIGHHTAE